MDALDAALCDVVDHHRDRGDCSEQDVVAYLDPGYKPGSAASRASFEAGVRLVRDGFRVRDPIELDQGTFGDRLATYVASLDPRERLARLQVAGHVLRLAYERYRAALRVTGIPEHSRLDRLYPELRVRLTEKDQLLPIEEGVELNSTWLTYKRHAIHCHPAIHRDLGARRGNTELFSHLAGVVSESVSLAVAVDSSRVCPKDELFEILEADRWFGRPFAAADLDDLHAVGRTVLARSRALGSFRHQREGLLTEVRWTSDGVVKNFEIEELPNPVTNEPTLCRFVHAIRNPKSEQFIHLDGALHVYPPHDFELRREQVMANTGKVYAAKTKLFRLDQVGQAGIQTDDWSAIVQSFFRGNELVLEYFSGQSYDEIYRATYGHGYPYPRQ